MRCARGSIVDVLVDIRRGSPTYGQWEAYELDDSSLRLLYAPVGFAHGFCVTSEVADVTYKLSSYYDPAVETRVRLRRPRGGHRVARRRAPGLSERDATAPRLSEIAAELPFTA